MNTTQHGLERAEPSEALEPFGRQHEGSTGQFLNGVVALPQLGVIRVEGSDAASFLQSQLTQDFAVLGLSEARLAAFCTAKGRMQASFVGFKRSHGDILLIVSRDILAPTLKRLSMFVLRAKAKLRDATAEFSVYGLAGHPAVAAAPKLSEPWTRADVGNASVIRLYPSDGQARSLWVAPPGEPAPPGPELSQERWLWGEVRSGIANITAPIVEAFVPQMLNYESVGGVSFKKGCYPGQEVVARSQFRGILKRRAYLAHAQAELHAGQEIFDPADASQPCGLVAQAARAPGGGWDAIVSIQMSAAEAGGLRAGAPEGGELSLQPPPYPLLVDV